MGRMGFARAFFENLENRVLLSTFTVVNTADSGAGSLRQAILDANANTGADRINFAIGTGVQTIQPLSALPNITDDVTIDGTTQPGYGGKPIVVLDGSKVTDGDGLTLAAGKDVVYGLVINQFSGTGILNQSDEACTIQRNFIGTDRTGKLDKGNGKAGITIAGASNTHVGSENLADANIIAFNGKNSTGLKVAYPGVLMYGGGTKNSVLGNSIFDNHGPGIDIVRGTETAPDGINPLDQLDADTGTNNLQNFAALTVATSGSTDTYTVTTLIGNLQAAPNTDYRIEFFANPRFNSGSVQGKTLYHVETVRTDAKGLKSFTFQPVPGTTGSLVTATTTDPGGNTSEFCLAALNDAGSVRGTVYDDLNGDGVRNTGEPGLAGVTAYDDRNGNGTMDTGETNTVSDAKGNYILEHLVGGPTQIRVTPFSGRRLTSPAAGYNTITLPNIKTKGRNFGLTTTAIVRGTVFNDVNSNGTQDTGEAGLSAWTVYIDKNNDGKFNPKKEKVRLANSRGDYRFAGLTPGTYIIRIVPKTGFTTTAPASGLFKLKLTSGRSLSNRRFGEKAIA